MPRTVKVIYRKRRNRAGWPSYSVTEMTDAGGYRNRIDFQFGDAAYDYARRLARKLGAELIDS